MKTVLEIRNLNYAYHTLEGETSALSDISFSMEAGEFVAVVGPSGCGNALDDQRKQLACSPSQTTLSKIILKYSLFSGTLNVSYRL